MNPDDRYIAVNFDGAKGDELLAISAGGWAHLMRYGGGAWQTPWINNGSGKINWWVMKPSDQYVVGDFDGDGRTELLAVAVNGWSHLMKYDGSTWQTPWINNGSGKLNWWNINPGDKYVAGDFDKDGRDELLAVAANGWSQLMRYDGSAWQTPWMNEGAGTMHLWFMKSTDKYVSGDFDKDGLADLFSVSVNGWSHLMKYTLPYCSALLGGT